MSPTLLEAAKAKLEGKRVEFVKDNGFWYDGCGGWWRSDMVFRIAPEPKKKVKFLCWYDGDQMFWLRDNVEPKWISKRIPSEDKEVEIEND